jgi:prolycopene isomerase
MDTADPRNMSRQEFLKLVAASTAALAIDWNKLEALAAEIGPREDLPVVVIGGGLGGLSAAAHLARRGFPVTLVEQHFKPGGYATSFERANGKFVFDVSLHATGSAQGSLRPVLEGAGVAGKVETIELPDLCRIITPDHDLTWPQRDPEAIVAQLVQLFPQESDGIRGFFDYMLGILDEAMKPFDRDSWWDRLTFPLTHRKMWGIRNKTLADVLDEDVHDASVRSILSTFWGYYGLPPSRLSGFYYCIATAAYMRFGGHYIKQRSQDLSDALLESIRENGGQVLLGTEATGITLKDGAVTGVALREGSELDAKAVISNASVPATMQMLAEASARGDYPEEAADYLERLATYRPALSTFIVWLGLNQEIRGEIEGYEIFVDQGNDPEQAYQAALACDPTGNSLGVTVYDNAFEGYSQPGTSTVAVLMLSGYEPWRRFEADYFAGRKDEYRREKDRIAQALIERAEQLVIPGLTSMIEVMEAATPLTNVRYTRNPEGSIYGYEQSLANSFMTRLAITTPFKGLYLASAWSNPGGGYEPCLGSGVSAVTALMRDWGVEA